MVRHVRKAPTAIPANVFLGMKEFTVIVVSVLTLCTRGGSRGVGVEGVEGRERLGEERWGRESGGGEW